MSAGWVGAIKPRTSGEAIISLIGMLCGATAAQSGAKQGIVPLILRPKRGFA